MLELIDSHDTLRHHNDLNAAIKLEAAPEPPFPYFITQELRYFNIRNSATSTTPADRARILFRALKEQDGLDELGKTLADGPHFHMPGRSAKAYPFASQADEFWNQKVTLQSHENQSVQLKSTLQQAFKTTFEESYSIEYPDDRALQLCRFVLQRYQFHKMRATESTSAPLPHINGIEMAWATFGQLRASTIAAHIRKESMRRQSNESIVEHQPDTTFHKDLYVRETGFIIPAIHRQAVVKLHKSMKQRKTTSAESAI